MQLKHIETYEEAVPLSDAGLLWFTYPYFYGDKIMPDEVGYWTKYRDRGDGLWDREANDGVKYYIMLED